jgi:hypothetical protein
MFSVRSNGILMYDVHYCSSLSASHAALHKINFKISTKTAVSRRPKSGRYAALERQKFPQTLHFSPTLHTSIITLSIVLPSSLTNASPLFPTDLAPDRRAGTAWEPVKIFFLPKNCKWNASYCTHTHTHCTHARRHTPHTRTHTTHTHTTRTRAHTHTHHTHTPHTHTHTPRYILCLRLSYSLDLNL